MPRQGSVGPRERPTDGDTGTIRKHSIQYLGKEYGGAGGREGRPYEYFY